MTNRMDQWTKLESRGSIRGADDVFRGALAVQDAAEGSVLTVSAADEVRSSRRTPAPLAAFAVAFALVLAAGGWLLLVPRASLDEAAGNPVVPFPGVPEEQHELLADGEVSLVEYRAALQNAAACVGDEGWDVEEIFQVPFSDRLSFNVILPDDADQNVEDAVSADLTRCLATHADDVERVYLRSIAPTGADRDAMIGSLVDCLRDLGVETASPDMREEDFVTAIVSTLPEDRIALGFQCMDSHAGLFVD